MKPLCEKDYLHKIPDIIVTAAGIFFDTFFIINMDNHIIWRIVITLFTILLAIFLIDIIYWVFQPHVLIYQYDEGIIIKRKIKIEYKSIKKIDYENYIFKRPRGNYYRSPYVGTIIIQLKSGKIHKIRNAFYPLGAVDVLSPIKLQKKFK